MTNTKPAAQTLQWIPRKTLAIGHRVTCTECGLTYGDHRYLCSKDPNAAFFDADRAFLAAQK